MIKSHRFNSTVFLNAENINLFTLSLVSFSTWIAHNSTENQRSYECKSNNFYSLFCIQMILNEIEKALHQFHTMVDSFNVCSVIALNVVKSLVISSGMHLLRGLHSFRILKLVVFSVYIWLTFETYEKNDSIDLINIITNIPGFSAFSKKNFWFLGYDIILHLTFFAEFPNIQIEVI